MSPEKDDGKTRTLTMTGQGHLQAKHTQPATHQSRVLQWGFEIDIVGKGTRARVHIVSTLSPRDSDNTIFTPKNPGGKQGPLLWKGQMCPGYHKHTNTKVAVAGL